VITPRLIDAQSGFYKTRLERWAELPGPLKLRLKAMVVMRTRFAEDCLGGRFVKVHANSFCSVPG
jgi:hypothetical protein